MKTSPAKSCWNLRGRLREVLENPVAAYVLLGLFWALVRAYPLSRCSFWGFWEVWEVRKLLDYGFWARHGAVLDSHFMMGILSHPESFNYVNHPYPPLWAMAGVYSVAGAWGVVAANAAFGLGATLVTLWVLRRCFTPTAAWCGALLGALAPSDIFFSYDTHLVAMGARFWPLIALVICAGVKVGERGRAWLLGLLMFLAAQTSWFSLSMLPALLYWVHRREGAGRFPSGAQVALLAGAAASTLLFAVQIAVYSPNLGGILSYASGQCGFSPHELSRARMFLGIALRAGVMVGPALLLGSAAGLLAWRGWGRADRGVPAAGIYLVSWVFSAVVLTRFFYRERAMYEYLVFPGAFLVAGFWQHGGRPWARRGLLALGFLGAFYPQLQATIPAISVASRAVGQVLAERVGAREIVLTNLVDQEPPFEAWDVGSIYHASFLADRIVRPGIRDIGNIQSALKGFEGRPPAGVFLRDLDRPCSPEFLSRLKGLADSVETVTLAVTRESPGLAGRLRYRLWKAHGQFRNSAGDRDGPPERPLRLEIYRLSAEGMARWAGGDP